MTSITVATHEVTEEALKSVYLTATELFPSYTHSLGDTDEWGYLLTFSDAISTATGVPQKAVSDILYWIAETPSKWTVTDDVDKWVQDMMEL